MPDSPITFWVAIVEKTKRKLARRYYRDVDFPSATTVAPTVVSIDTLNGETKETHSPVIRADGKGRYN